MIQFLQPIWLWAITGITIPLAIHLWNTREGKTVKVGSIMLVQEAASSQARSLKLAQWLLLLLRCLLVICCALILAQPYFTTTATDKKSAGWVLLPRSKKQQAYIHFSRQVDSLVKAGYELHLLEKDFPATASSPGDSLGQEDINYWELIPQLNDRLGAKQSVYLFTDNQQRHFSGERPSTKLDIHWNVYSPTDSVSREQFVFTTTSDSCRHLILHTSAKGSYYSTTTGAASGGDTGALRIAIYPGRNSADAAYLYAALQAIGDFTTRKIIVQILKENLPVPANAEWLFWLSEQTTPQFNRHLFSYAAGTPVSANLKVSAAGNIQFNCYQLRNNKTSLIPLWSSGNAVVLGQDKTNSLHVVFNSRFHPQWSDLVWQPQFPQLIATLVLGNRADSMLPLLNGIDQNQLEVSKVAPGKILDSVTTKHDNKAEHWLWFIAFLLLVMERLLSFKSKQPAA